MQVLYEGKDGCGESKADFGSKMLSLPLVPVKPCTLCRSVCRVWAEMCTGLECWPQPTQSYALLYQIWQKQPIWGTLVSSRSKTAHNRSKPDRHRASAAKKTRWQKASHMSTGTRRSSGSIYRQLTSSWRPQAEAFKSSPHLQAQLPRSQGTGSWVGWGLSSGFSPRGSERRWQLRWGAGADGKAEIPVLVTVISFVFSQITSV